MRVLIAAAVLAASAFAGAATAQTPVGVPTTSLAGAPPPAGLTDSEMRRRNALLGEGWQYRMAPPDAAAIAAMRAAAGPPAADLSNIDARIKSDEVALTRLRDGELARENAISLSIQPGRPYGWHKRPLDPSRYLISIDPYLKALFRDIVAIPDRIF